MRTHGTRTDAVSSHTQRHPTPARATPARADGAPARRTRFRALFISDTHLGTAVARAGDLAFFLKHVECDRLYLVGDIVDMWRLRRRWWWPPEHNTVVRRIIKMATRGSEVVFIPGNHDDAARAFAGHAFGGIEIRLNATHATADGRHLLVCHGDQYDLVVRHHRLLSAAGSIAYEALIACNRWWNRWRSVRGLPYWSMSAEIKRSVKRVCQFVSHFEAELEAEARRGGFDGVVCGHIHQAACAADPESDRVAYYNCGDWVESCTALAEHEDGRFEVIDGLAFNEQVRAQQAAEPPTAESEPEPDLEEEWPEPVMPFPLPARPGRASPAPLQLVEAGA